MLLVTTFNGHKTFWLTNIQWTTLLTQLLIHVNLHIFVFTYTDVYNTRVLISKAGLMSILTSYAFLVMDSGQTQSNLICLCKNIISHLDGGLLWSAKELKRLVSGFECVCVCVGGGEPFLKVDCVFWKW